MKYLSKNKILPSVGFCSVIKVCTPIASKVHPFIPTKIRSMLSGTTFYHKTILSIERIKYYYIPLWNKISRLIDQSG